jgi:hypothetical protein
VLTPGKLGGLNGSTQHSARSRLALKKKLKALAEIDERETQIEEMDIQAAVGFGEFVLLNASRLWVQLSSNQKQRLQQTICPQGVQFENGAYRTSETSIVFIELEPEKFKKEGLVALTGIEPVFQP